MTVKDAIKVLKHAKDIEIAYSGNAIPFDINDALMVDAYGNYVVDEIRSNREEHYEISILMRPVKAESA